MARLPRLVPLCSRRSFLVATPIALVIALAPSCKSFGATGDKVPLDVTSTPSDAELYVFDETLWYGAARKRYEDARAKGAWDAWFDRYKETSGRTPLTLKIGLGIQHILARQGTTFVHCEYAPATSVPSPGEHRKLNIELK